MAFLRHADNVSVDRHVVREYGDRRCLVLLARLELAISLMHSSTAFPTSARAAYGGDPTRFRLHSQYRTSGRLTLPVLRVRAALLRLRTLDGALPFLSYRGRSIPRRVCRDLQGLWVTAAATCASPPRNRRSAARTGAAAAVPPWRSELSYEGCGPAGEDRTRTLPIKSRPLIQIELRRDVGAASMDLPLRPPG